MAGGGNFQGSQRRPGFTPGGPNDPASGGSGYTGGGMGRIMAQNAFGSDMGNMGSGGTDSWGGNYGDQTGYRLPGFVPGGPDDPANGGSGYMGGRGLMQGYSCFIDGVQVELVDGSEKNVSEINIGDEVKTDKGDGVVTKVYPSKAGGQKLYGFNDKEPFVTEAHPFMTQDGWKKISEVSKGDTLYRNGKGDVTVESITAKEIPEDTPVYNFHVDGHETYFADGYLVHNKTYAPGYEPGGENFVPGTGPRRGWGGGPDWNVQNPGMGYWPGSGYPLPPRWGNAGYPDSGWGSGIQQGVGISEPAPGTPGNADGTNETVTAETAQSNPWAGISQGRLGQAQRFANAGQFGRAKQQIGLGGGNWDDVGGLLRTEAAADDNYGGDWNWGGASDADVAQAQRFANAGMMGRAKGVMGDNWNNQMQTQFQAEGNANPYVKGQSMGFDWGNVGDKRLAQSKALAQQGKFGQAKKMFTGGVAGKSQGTWDPNIARQMRAWHKGNQ